MLSKMYDTNFFSYDTSLHTSEHLQSAMIIEKRVKMNMSKREELVSLSDWIEFETNHKDITYSQIIKLLEENNKSISTLRGRPNISFLVNTQSTQPNDIAISKLDKRYFKSVIEKLATQSDEIDVILHSVGGTILSTVEIVHYLHQQFRVVNFLIPEIAHSSATMMCMSANEIVMTQESTLSPFNILLENPTDKKLVNAEVLLKVAKSYKRSLYSPFFKKEAFPGWSKKIAEVILSNNRESMKQIYLFPTLWLGKYMFKTLREDMTLYEYEKRNLLTKLSKNERAIKKIIDCFVGMGENISHHLSIPYDEAKACGLNVQLADGELLRLLNEVSLLSENIFKRSSISKLYLNSDAQHIYQYQVNK